MEHRTQLKRYLSPPWKCQSFCRWESAPRSLLSLLCHHLRPHHHPPPHHHCPLHQPPPSPLWHLITNTKQTEVGFRRSEARMTRYCHLNAAFRWWKQDRRGNNMWHVKATYVYPVCTWGICLHCHNAEHRQCITAKRTNWTEHSRAW